MANRFKSGGKNAAFESDATGSASLDYLTTINRILATGWTANLDRYGRIYYSSHATQTTQWIPPAENWDPGEWRLPYGWECAADPQGRIYYINAYYTERKINFEPYTIDIETGQLPLEAKKTYTESSKFFNHIEKFTTYEDPRMPGDDDSEQDISAIPREVTLHRDQTIGFGFVAGSEKPVIVRFVNEDGPSAGKLLPADLILRINGEDVEKAPRDHVIELVRACKDVVTLTVCQPQSDNASRKSAFLSAAKKAKLKNKPSRVRFADGVVINGSGNLVATGGPEPAPSPFIPNVLKVFLENGQTKSFKYDSITTVKDVMSSLKEKLSIHAIEHFGLVVEHVKSVKKNQLKLLSPDDTIAKIAARPGAQHLRCLFRLMFVPRDAFELLRKDPVAFDYFYMQCCNDVIDERFATELRCDVALRLAALHMQQHGLSNNVASKVSVKRMEKDCGLERFIPPSILEAMKHKELRRLLSHLIKVNNQQLSAPGQKKLTELQVKVHYLKILGELPTFGGRCFNVTIPESKSDGLILISPKFGVSQISGTKTGSPVMLCELEAISEVVIADIPDAFHSIELHIKPPLNDRFSFEAESSDDLEDMVQLLNGYSKLLLGLSLRVLIIDDNKDDSSKSPNDPPSYYGHHVVYSMPWSYPAELKAITIQNSDETVHNTVEHYADFSLVPAAVSPLKTLSAPQSPAHTLLPEPADLPATELSSILPNHPHIPCIEPDPDSSSVPTHVEINLTGPSPTSIHTPAPPDIVRNMKFIDDSTSSDLDTPVAERALKRAQPTELNHVRENDAVIRVRPGPAQVEMSSLSGAPLPSCGNDEPDVIKRTNSRTGSSQELAEKLSSLQTPTIAGDKGFPWHPKMDLASDSEETDSVSTTPTDSPVHKGPETVKQVMGHRIANPPSTLFRSGSSFGLHSPDDVGKYDDGIQVYIDNVAEIEMLRLEQSSVQRQSVGSLYMDPDIIDLCQIPIPEEVDEYMEYTDVVEVPPTPFRDPLIPFPGSDMGTEQHYLPGIAEDSPSRVPVGASPNLVRDCVTVQKSSVALDQALYELNSFISAMTIPDPEDEHPHLHRVTSEDIRMLVIPPPPSHSPARPDSAASRETLSPSSSRHSSMDLIESPLLKPPIPPKPRVIPPPPPPRNKSLERKKTSQTNSASRKTPHDNSPTPDSVVASLISPRSTQRASPRRTPNREIENTEAFKDCVAEINAQLSEIAIRRGAASSESDLVSTTPSASEESTPIMWRKNPVLNCKTNRKPPIVGGIHPNATLPFALSKSSPGQLKNRYRTRPPSREKLRKRLAAVRVQAESKDILLNGHEEEENEASVRPVMPRTTSSGPSGITRVDIQATYESLPRIGGHAQWETDAEVLERVCDIISEIDWTLDSIRRPETITPNVPSMRLAREQLVSEARRFVTASKTFVKSATVMLGGDAQLGGAITTDIDANSASPRGGRPTSLTGSVSYRHSAFHESLVRCTDLIAMMFQTATLVARYSPTTSEASKLVEGILLVAVAFRCTIQAAFRPSSSNNPVQENSLHDPAVKLLMSEATKLAASLTSLMRIIRSIEGTPNGTQSGFVALDEPPLRAAQ